MYRVTDADGDMATATATITIDANPDPVNDSFDIAEDTLLMGDVATNDDLGDAPATIGLDTGPSNGVLNLNADGTFDYTPDTGFSGIDSFIYSVTDADGDVATATATITIMSTGQQPGVSLVNGVLQVLGTDDRDIVRIRQRRSQLEVTTNIGTSSTQRFDLADVEAIDISLGDGNDFAQLHRSVTLNTTIEGGDGNDYLRAGRGDDVLDGGAGRDHLDGAQGNDKLRGGDGFDVLTGGRGNDILLGGMNTDFLFGEQGRDIVIGGDGFDVVRGQNGNDILVGGTTVHDDDDAALMAILDEWTSSGSFLTRVDNVQMGTGLTGGNTLSLGSTVLDDGNFDLLRGDSGRDLIFAFSDLVLGAGPNDLIER